jgi:hypothetical protein
LLSVPTDWLFSDAEWPPPVTPAPPSLQSVSDFDLTEEFCKRREELVKAVILFICRLSEDALQRLVQLAEKPTLSQEERVALDRGVRDVLALLSARTDLELMTPADYPDLQSPTKAQREAIGRLLERLPEKSSYSSRALPLDLWFSSLGLRRAKQPGRRQPADTQKTRQDAAGAPPNTASQSDNLESPGITSPGDSTHPTNADRLGKRPAGRKRRKAESP